MKPAVIIFVVVVVVAVVVVVVVAGLKSGLERNYDQFEFGALNFNSLAAKVGRTKKLERNLSKTKKGKCHDF